MSLSPMADLVCAAAPISCPVSPAPRVMVLRNQGQWPPSHCSGVTLTLQRCSTEVMTGDCSSLQSAHICSELLRRKIETFNFLDIHLSRALCHCHDSTIREDDSCNIFIVTIVATSPVSSVQAAHRGPGRVSSGSQEMVSTGGWRPL